VQGSMDAHGFPCDTGETIGVDFHGTLLEVKWLLQPASTPRSPRSKYATLPPQLVPGCADSTPSCFRISSCRSSALNITMLTYIRTPLACSFLHARLFPPRSRPRLSRTRQSRSTSSFDCLVVSTQHWAKWWKTNTFEWGRWCLCSSSCSADVAIVADDD
jgi:hypothetical protein